MADSKLTALADLPSAPVDTDYLYIVRGGVSYKIPHSAIKLAIADFAQYPEVANFSALPSAAANSGAIYVCIAAQGVYFVNRKPAGLYYSDGSTWAHLADATEAYFQDTLAWTNITSKPSTFPPSTHAHAASDVTSGVFAMARLATGTPNGTQFVRDDGTLATPPSGGGISDAPSDGSTYARRDGAWEAIPITEPTLIGTCLPIMNEPPASNFATLDTRNSHPVLDFDDTTEESAFFKLTIPQDVSIANGIAVKIHFMATSATSGNVRWGAAVERLSASSHDLDSDSFGTAAEQNAVVDTTSGEIAECTVTITSLDGLSSGGTFRLKIYRDSTDTTNDTATGDAEFLFAVVTGVA